jgi:hypothetical protein
MAKFRRGQWWLERSLAELLGRIGELITATSSASADATQTPQLKAFRSAIVP